MSPVAGENQITTDVLVSVAVWPTRPRIWLSLSKWCSDLRCSVRGVEALISVRITLTEMTLLGWLGWK